MTKNFRTGKNSLIIQLHGEIDQYAAAELKESIDIEVENSPKKNLIIDLKDVDLMDSSGIGLIVGRYKTVKTLGGKLLVSGGNENVRKMINLSGIGKVIKMHKSVPEADKALKMN